MQGLIIRHGLFSVHGTSEDLLLTVLALCASGVNYKIRKLLEGIFYLLRKLLSEENCSSVIE